MSYLRILLLPLVLLLVTTGIAAAKDKGGSGGNGSKPQHARVTLTAVGSDTDATGFAETFFKQNKNSTMQSFHLKVEKVAGNSSFTVMVDGTLLDTFSST